MSRIGKAPISVPGGVDIQISGQAVTVKGPKGQLTRELSDLVSISKDGDTLQVVRLHHADGSGGEKRDFVGGFCQPFPACWHEPI